MAGLFASVFTLLIVLVADLSTATPWSPVSDSEFHHVFGVTFIGVGASMVAYLTAQFIDVQLFHFWKRLTKGRHLWLRNNGSTTFSQLIDTTAILSILYFAGNLGSEIDSIAKLGSLILASYLFKFFFALFDTPFFYLGVYLLKEKIHDDPDEQKWEHHTFREEAL